jgi:DNA-binding response OmpR family regulator
VVEDHPDTRTAVAEHLIQCGFDVSVASDGDRAMHLLREMRPDVVYVDMNLPNISGYDVCEQIRGDPEFADRWIIMVSAQSSAEVEAFCLEAGADAFVAKPFDLKELGELVTRIIAQDGRSSS